NLTFNLRHIRPDGSTEVIASQKLHIQPFVHEHIWFWPAVIIPSLALVYYLFWIRTKHRREKEMLEVQYQKHVLESELTALRAQMNPHFVFNGLNSIRNYIFKEDKDGASAYLTMFSRLIRAILQNSQSKLIPLAEDLKALSLYLQIEAKRFKDEFEYSIDLASDVDPETTYVPPLLIQPYVENAIWHGLRLKPGNRQLHVGISRADQGLRIVVEDNGIGRQAAAQLDRSAGTTPHNSFGMQHTAERIGLLKEMLGVDATVQVEDLAPASGHPGTRVIIHLPHLTEQDATEIVQ
ncbi:MAG: histidine kinase, partial [Saprospiraceae bacterium]|nr:histidine kinase [Saprospiraceae bacterium]